MSEQNPVSSLPRLGCLESGAELINQLGLKTAILYSDLSSMDLMQLGSPAEEEEWGRRIRENSSVRKTWQTSRPALKRRGKKLSIAYVISQKLKIRK